MNPFFLVGGKLVCAIGLQALKHPVYGGVQFGVHLREVFFPLAYVAVREERAHKTLGVADAARFTVAHYRYEKLIRVFMLPIVPLVPYVMHIFRERFLVCPADRQVFSAADGV